MTSIRDGVERVLKASGMEPNRWQAHALEVIDSVLDRAVNHPCTMSFTTGRQCGTTTLAASLAVAVSEFLPVAIISPTYQRSMWTYEQTAKLFIARHGIPKEMCRDYIIPASGQQIGFTWPRFPGFALPKGPGLVVIDGLESVLRGAFGHSTLVSACRTQGLSVLAFSEIEMQGVVG